MDTVRVFVGCLLDLGTTRKVADLGRAVQKLAESAGWQASWVPPPNLHVTLRFLGDVDAGLVAPLSDALASVAARSAPVRVQVSGVSAFPGTQAPAVVFAELLRGHDAVAALASAVEDALEAVGIPRESRAFHGHVTLARVRAAQGALRDIVPPGTDCGTATITEMCLYRSDVLRGGAEYLALSRHPLGPAGPVAPQPDSPGRPGAPTARRGQAGPLRRDGQ